MCVSRGMLGEDRLLMVDVDKIRKFIDGRGNGRDLMERKRWRWGVGVEGVVGVGDKNDVV